MAKVNQAKTRVRQAQTVGPVVTIDVRSLSNFAFVAGLGVDRAQRILVESPQWRYPTLRCMGCDNRTPHVIVDHAWEGRSMLYCCGCGLVDLWV